MKITEKLVEEIDRVTDITCDSCGKSCKTEISLFEFMKLEAHWGYDSNHDMQIWKADVCEECVVIKLQPLIKFQIEDRLQLDLYNDIMKE